MKVPIRAAIAGAASAAVALGVGELLGGALPGAPSPIAAVGALIIERQPPGAKDLMVALFGESDKAAFEVIIAGASIVLGAILGVVALRWLWLAQAGFVGGGGSRAGSDAGGLRGRALRESHRDGLAGRRRDGLDRTGTTVERDPAPVPDPLGLCV